MLWDSLLWIASSAAIQANASLNGAVGIDWVNTILWVATAASTLCWSRDGSGIGYVLS